MSNGCETWSITFKEEQKLSVFDNNVLRKIFWAKRVEITGEWRTLDKLNYSAFRLSVARSTAAGDATADSPGPDRQIEINTPMHDGLQLSKI